MSEASVGYVLSYTNPDTDGVMSAFAVADLRKKAKGDQYTAMRFGALDAETRYVLEVLGMAPPTEVHLPIPNVPIALVDTHHPEQLPEGFPVEQVLFIYDHHPAGSPEAFPNASIRNEAVGAAATLIAEEYRAGMVTPEPDVASGLAAAIVSNTLNFHAPSTTSRDITAHQWLSELPGYRDVSYREMFEARSAIRDVATPDVLRSGTKVFQIGSHHVAIVQVEALGIESLIARGDFLSALAEVQASTNSKYGFFSGVDLDTGTTILAAVDNSTQNVIEKALGVSMAGGIARVNRILLRKTDLVPALTRLLDH